MRREFRRAYAIASACAAIELADCGEALPWFEHVTLTIGLGL